MEPGTLCYVIVGIPTPDIGNYTYFGIFHEGKTLLCVTNFDNENIIPEMTFAPDDTFKELKSGQSFSLNLSDVMIRRYTFKDNTFSRSSIPKTQQLYIDLYSEKVQEELGAYQRNCGEEKKSCEQVKTLKKFKEKYLSAEQKSSTKVRLRF